MISFLQNGQLSFFFSKKLCWHAYIMNYCPLNIFNYENSHFSIALVFYKHLTLFSSKKIVFISIFYWLLVLLMAVVRGISEHMLT